MILAFGANLPFHGRQPVQTILAAMDELATLGVQFTAVSRAFFTPCFPTGAGPDFINAAAKVEFADGIEPLLALCHQTEAAFGRSRDARWSARTLDIDILAAGHTILPDLETWQYWCDLAPKDQATVGPAQLILPHPRLHERAFMLIPMDDVAPNWMHPTLQKTTRQLKTALAGPDFADISPIEWPQGQFATLPLPERSPK